MATSVDEFTKQGGQLGAPNTEPWTYADAPRTMYYKQQSLETSQRKTEQTVSHLQSRQNILTGALIVESVVILAVLILSIKMWRTKLK